MRRRPSAIGFQRRGGCGGGGDLFYGRALDNRQHKLLAVHQAALQQSCCRLSQEGMRLAALDLVNLNAKAGSHTGMNEGMQQGPANSQVARQFAKLETPVLNLSKGLLGYNSKIALLSLTLYRDQQYVEMVSPAARERAGKGCTRGVLGQVCWAWVATKSG